ncbi:hydantoinase B/oxoprolinase family protein [Acuticoccus sp. I52.16.1]|uniref:hydantoinase B/oxoprolinase family protein n=1 Tax=Acuticoccus sp. I52.16.1 TaxID=2928472 RepID=UPI00211178C8|nr:hydantoinase B/oxoprolinase family protein [Acuticoccus sp. I52.16.1]
MSAADAIRNQVMWDRLIAVVEEQAQALLRTAFSTIVREAGDLSAGVFDLEGRMLAQAVTGTPGHVNSMAESVKHFIDVFPVETMKEGDHYITNDPWRGTGHLNDFVVTTPAFHDGKMVGLFSCTSHLIDIGGIGFGPDGHDVFAEGINIPFLKICDQGRMDANLMAMIRANTRLPVETEGDVYSLISCNEIGAKRLSEMMGEYGLTSLDALAGHIIGASRAAALERIAALPRGTTRNSMTIDGLDKPIDLVAALTVAEDGIHVDYDGTSGTAKKGINVPLAYTRAYTAFGLMAAIAKGIPNNAGSLSVWHIEAPVGCILNAPRGLPVSSRHIIGQMLPDVMFGCLADMIPEVVPAEGTSCLWNVTLRGQAEANSLGRHGFAVTITTNGGTGARPDKDGLSATAFPSGVKGSPVEIMEQAAPVVVWKKELRDGSGGAGRFRGGDGQSIEIENRFGQSMELLAAFDRIDHPPRGRAGGGNGACGSVALSDGTKLKGKGTQEIPAGKRLCLETPGGGGYGTPAAEAGE